MNFEGKAEERLRAVLKLQCALAPADCAAVLALCAGDDAEAAGRVPGHIFGEAEDPRERRRFLQTSANRHGPSFRSPFSNLYYPDGARGPTDAGLLGLEAQLNAFLDGYARARYSAATTSAFVAEGKDETVFTLALLRDSAETPGACECHCRLALFAQIRLARKDTNYKFGCTAKLHYRVALVLPELQESARQQGCLGHSAARAVSSLAAPSPEELVEVVASMFESAETGLKNALLCSALRGHRDRAEALLFPSPPPATALQEVLREFRARQSPA